MADDDWRKRMEAERRAERAEERAEWAWILLIVLAVMVLAAVLNR